MKNVTKDIFLNALTCPALGWLLRHDQAAASASVGDRLRALEGQEIGCRARAERAPGILIESHDMIQAADETASLLADPQTKILYEGAFGAGSYVTRADILVRRDDGWAMIEVKSALNDKPELTNDMAYTTMVMRRAGVNITRTELMLLNKRYRLGMSDHDLFTAMDKTGEVLDRAAEFDTRWDEIDQQTGSEAMPRAELVFGCRGCPELSGCVGKGIENPLFDLPRLSEGRFDELRAHNLLRIEDIPATLARTFTERQHRVWRSVVDGRPFVGKQLARRLALVAWPAYYLDFETMKTAIPVYPDTAPHEQILTQYSIHILAAPDAEPGHREYLADPARDCRRELAERLLADLGTSGSIISYSQFEKTMINGLAERFPDLRPGLDNLVGRIYDLEKLLRDQYYQTEFHGRSSIKVTLPVMVPEMSYEHLAIGDGDSASATFALMAMGRKLGSPAPTLRRRLLEYCGQDTLAMVRLHAALLRIAA